MQTSYCQSRANNLFLNPGGGKRLYADGVLFIATHYNNTEADAHRPQSLNQSHLQILVQATGEHKKAQNNSSLEVVTAECLMRKSLEKMKKHSLIHLPVDENKKGPRIWCRFIHGNALPENKTVPSTFPLICCKCSDDRYNN